MALNNVHHVSQVLKNIRSELDLERYYKWLDEEKQEVPLSERAESTITSILDSTNEDILNKLEDVTSAVKAKVRKKDFCMMISCMILPSPAVTICLRIYSKHSE